MSEYISSPLMNMPVPIVNVAPGPNYAYDVNNCLGLIDSHDHSFGKGTPVTPLGLNINSDLTIESNNLTNVRSVRFSIQSSAFTAPADINCLYDINGDAYFMDGLGRNVRITQDGGVAGSPGSITNLTPPASASYTSINQTFVFQSATNTPANLDAGSVIFRNILSGSNGVTLMAPSALASNYNLTLPLTPLVQSFMTLDSSGNMAAPWTVDNSTIEISGGTTVQVKDGGITSAKLAPLNSATSSSCGAFTTNSSGFVTNLSVTITTTGRPVSVGMLSDGSGLLAAVQGVQFSGATYSDYGAIITIYRDSSPIATQQIRGATSATVVGGPGRASAPVSAFSHIDTPSAGSHTYEIHAQILTGQTDVVAVQYAVLMAYEL
jgi:hypothetical protein